MKSRSPECCDSSLVRQEGNYHYLESGVPNVYLENVEWYECEECGRSEAIIPRIGQLHRCIAWRIICKPDLLAGPEIRFLRKMLRISQSDFADVLNVHQTQLSRWENNKRKVRARPTDHLIRFLYVVLKRDEFTEELHREIRRFADRLAMLKRAAHGAERDTIVIDPSHCSGAEEVSALLEG